MNVKTKKDKKWAISELTKSMNFFKEASRNGFSIEYFYGKELGTREAIQILEKLDEPETVEGTTRLLENVLKENKRLGKLLEEKYEEWLELMDKTNNPETLSEYWIEQKSIDTHVDTLSGEVQVTFRLDDLQNLLVPQQEELEVKIQDLIEIYKQEEGAYSNRENGWISGFVEDLKNLLEEEQKYYVIFPSVDEDSKGFNYLAKDCYHKELWVEDTRTDGLVWEERSSFTEDEIRDLDKGDILFEHFSVNVKELEE